MEHSSKQGNVKFTQDFFIAPHSKPLMQWLIDIWILNWHLIKWDDWDEDDITRGWILHSPPMEMLKILPRFNYIHPIAILGIDATDW